MNANQLLEQAETYSEEHECHIEWAIAQIVVNMTDDEKVDAAGLFGERAQMWADALVNGSEHYNEEQVRSELVVAIRSGINAARIKKQRGWQ